MRAHQQYTIQLCVVGLYIIVNAYTCNQRDYNKRRYIVNAHVRIECESHVNGCMHIGSMTRLTRARIMHNTLMHIQCSYDKAIIYF